MDSILDKLRGAKYLSKIDLKAAYHQIPMARESKKYTAFDVPSSGLWQFTRMSFGLTQARYNFPTAHRLTFRLEARAECFWISRRHHNRHGDLRGASEMGTGSVK